MENEKKNWKATLKSILFILFFAIIGGVGGYLIAPYIGEITFWDIIYTIVVLTMTFPLHIILHELGHLLGGLLSGYEFIMFRLFSTVWIKTEEGISRRREYVTGLLGQALMVPPETEEGEQPPFFLYHASGILMNILTGLLFIYLGRIIPLSWLSSFFYISSSLAFFLAVMNAVPSQGTDGYNILQHFKREETSSEVTHLLYIYRDMVQGASLESLQKYVDLDSLDSFKNPNTATFYSLRANYFFERQDFEEARKIYQTLYDNIDDLFEGHRPIVILNYLYSLLLTDSSHPDIPKLIETKAYKQSNEIKQSDYIRYQGAVEMYFNKNLEKTEKLLTEGKEYIPLAPTVTEEKFEKAMYQYLWEDLENCKKSEEV